MNMLRYIARSYIFPLALKIGVDKILRFFSKPNILHITYHGVVEKDSTFFSPRHIDVKQFEKQIEYFKKNFKIISVEESFNLVKNKTKLNNRYISISFDDGFLNNLSVALEVIEKHEVPVTVYVSSICIENDGNRVLWSELTAALLYFYKDVEVIIDGFHFVNLYDYSKNIYINDHIKSLSYKDRDPFLKRLNDEYQLSERIKTLPNEIWALLKENDLQEMASSKWITIGSHGHNHFNLGQIDIKDAENELVKSKRILESVLGYEVNQIAYPDGSYNEDVKSVARKCGYQIQYAVSYKSVKDANESDISDRFGISSTTTFESNILFLNYKFFKK